MSEEWRVKEKNLAFGFEICSQGGEQPPLQALPLLFRPHFFKSLPNILLK